ncbi:MAG: hypothetical protein LBK66_01355 [Spirochaetaceae bacterium]|jgi:hypothetical protein|nr:hypothetical protein [Spirochaetaceae bacterium]
MKKRLIPKILRLLVLYFAIFIVISLIQFAPAASFSKHIGNMRISGNFEKKTADTQYEQPNGVEEFFVKDDTLVFFGGLEFRLLGETAGGLAYTEADGVVHAAYPESMTLYRDRARFKLSGGQELLFYANSEAGASELIINALITGDVKEILLPFRALSGAKTKNDGFGDFSVDYNNAIYAFEMGNIDERAGVISLSSEEPSASYRIIPSYDSSDLANFIVFGGMEAQDYNKYLTGWLDAAFVNWERRINAGNFDENLVAAFLAESAQRGVLRRSAAMLPPVFRRSNTHTFLSVPFLGGLSASLNGFIIFERERMNRITSYTQTDTSAFLTEPRVFEYLANTGNYELFNSGIDYVNTLNPAAITLDMCAGIFEGWITWEKWEKWGKLKEGSENPFETLIARAHSVILASIKKDNQKAHVFVMNESDGYVDARYNLRAGSALSAYGEAADNNEWAAMGRSLILSALSFSAEDSSISGSFALSAGGEFTASASAGVLTSAEIYTELRLSNFYPHSAGIDTVSGSVFIWTAAPNVNSSFTNNVLDLAITFQTGEPHYIYMVNVPPFSRIQMRNITDGSYVDWRSDSQFEQYNAPGWLYSAATNVLMLKIVQQDEVDHVRIFF